MSREEKYNEAIRPVIERRKQLCLEQKDLAFHLFNLRVTGNFWFAIVDIARLESPNSWKQVRDLSNKMSDYLAALGFEEQASRELFERFKEVYPDINYMGPRV